MKSSKEIFRKEIDKAFSQVGSNIETMKDMAMFKNEFKEFKKSEILDKIKSDSGNKPKTKKKIENKEASTSGGVGSFEPPMSGEEPKKVEATEATTGVGAYSTPAMWAKSTNKKDWRGKSKTQIPGGSFVSIKKKCKTFPYCNQGDIKALDIYENKSLKEAIKNVSEKFDISENVIKSILQYEIERKLINK